MWDIKDSFNNPQDLRFELLRKKLTNNLLHLDLSQIAKQTPAIHSKRRGEEHYSKFDMFSMAFHDPTLLNTILYDWDVKDSYVPIAYFVLHGLPDYIYSEEGKKAFVRRVRAVAQIPELFGIFKMPLFTLLKESLETTDSYKRSSRVPNVITLQVLLDQGLPGLDKASPETSPRLTPENRNYMLKLFANARKQTYEDPLHTEILLDAFNRFMKYYPDWPLKMIMTVLVDGTSSSDTDKNVFYFEAMRIIYHKAIELYYPANKDEFLHIVRQIFSKRCWDPRYLDLKNQLAADLLVKDLDVNEIGSFGWVNSESADSLPWIAKFKALIEVMENNRLIPLLKDRNITSYFKSLVTAELLQRKTTGSLSGKEETVIIELNTWNSLKEEFSHHGENEEILASTLKTMKDSGLLNAERILYLARMYKTPKQKAALKALGKQEMFRYVEGGEDKFNHQAWTEFRAMTHYKLSNYIARCLKQTTAGIEQYRNLTFKQAM